MLGEGACPRSRGGPQRPGPADCLAKTQPSANPQGDVWGVTPARCRKVKGRGQRKRSLELKPR